MRDRESVEREIEEKRDDLVAGISELKDTIVDKVDIKKRARRALTRGKDEAVELTSRARELGRERPGMVVAVIAGVAGLIAVGVALRRRRNR